MAAKIERSRDLLPRDDSTTSGTAATATLSRIQCTANVMGIVPFEIAAGLTTTPSPSARLDDHASGISFLIGRRSPDSNNDDQNCDSRRILLWEHSTQTMNEQIMKAPNYGVSGVTLLHPEHHSADSVTNNDNLFGSNHNLLVACLGGFSTRRVVGGGGNIGSSATTANSSFALRHVYAASPTTGVLCVWVLDSNSSVAKKQNNRSGGVDQHCDASIRLKLKDQEILTSLVPMNASHGTSSWLLVSTSHGRLLKIYKTSRPLTLHAKSVTKRIISAVSVSGNNEGDGTGTTAGIVRGLYNYFTTPSKSHTNHHNGTDMLVESGGMYGHGHSTDDDENIVAVIPLPPTMTTTKTSTEDNATPRKNPGSSPARSPPPRKQQRLSNIAPMQYASLSPSPPPCARVVSLSTSLALKTWNISMLAGMEPMDGANIDTNSATDFDVNREGCTSITTLFPRTNDGVLDLSSLAEVIIHKSNNSNFNMILQESNNLEGYDTVDLLTRPALAKDGNSIIIGIRISKHNDLDATRAYVVRVRLIAGGGDQGEGNSTPCILDAAWLDRYSGQSLSTIGGILECAGLVVSEDSEEGMMNEGTASTMVGGSVVYVGFGPRSCGGSGIGVNDKGRGGLRPCPVTISTINFPSVNMELPRSDESGRQPPRAKDLDLDSSKVTSIIRNSMSYDSLTGGCVVLSTSGLLCGIHVRFPPVTTSGEGEGTTTTMTAKMSMDDASLVLLAQEESVVTIKTHLQSSFRQYITALKEFGGGEGGSSSNPARAVIPPSVMMCPGHILSAAVVLASKDYVCAPSGDGGGSGRGISSPFVPRRTSVSGSSSAPLTVLRDKLLLHKDFVTFLIHAGAYRRVSNAGRVRLRDQGEIITATRTLLIECHEYFIKEDSAIVSGDSSRRNELAHVRQMVMSALDGAANDVMILPKRLAKLQQLISPSDDTTPLKGMLLLMTSSSICEGIGQALNYRAKESSSLYDIPSFVSNSSCCSSWTSSTDMLDVLLSQLKFIHKMGEFILSTSNDYDVEKSNVQTHVADLSAATLSGYRDIVSSEPNNDDALVLYEEAKSLAIHLLRQYVNDEGDDIAALKSSVEHSFFEGIVQICHDHRKSWMYQGPFAEEDPDDRYDLRSMIASSSSDSPYAHLHQARDNKTGLSFCNYVLRWYTDRGYYSEVFELGKHCLHDLTRFVRNDYRLSNLAWRQHLRVDWQEKATVELMGIKTPLLFDNETGAMKLWEKEQMMSLAKLSNKLVVASDGTHSKVVELRTESIKNSLGLISIQRLLQGADDDGGDDEKALDADDILKLAVEKIQLSNDADEIKRFGAWGLSVASVKPSNQTEAMSNAASHIWHAIVKADINTWRDVANDNADAVGGMEDEFLLHRVEDTAFVGLLCDLFSNSSGGDMQHVGFDCANVKDQVFHALGSKKMANVLMAAADIVMNAHHESVIDDVMDG